MSSARTGRTILLGMVAVTVLGSCSSSTTNAPPSTQRPSTSATKAAPRFTDPRQIHAALIAGGFECKLGQGEQLPITDISGALRLDCFYRINQDVAMFTYANAAQERSDRRSQISMGNPLGRRLGGDGWDVYTALPDVLSKIATALH